MINPHKFYYFGYGSNMLAKRLHIQNPTAVRIGPGRLENYRLDFHTKSKKWLGAPATIVPTPNSYVLGAIWEIDCCNLKDLDDQEGVSQGIYVPLVVDVMTLCSTRIIPCRTYHLTNQPKQDLNCVMPDMIPHERKPSKTYLKVIVKGAMETGIPSEYVHLLRKVKHNGIMVHALEKQLELRNICL